MFENWNLEKKKKNLKSIQLALYLKHVAAGSTIKLHLASELNLD